MELICHTYIPEGGFMNRTYYAGFVHNCLKELSAINERIELLDPEIHKDQIARLRKNLFEIQLRVDVFSKRLDKDKVESIA